MDSGDSGGINKPRKITQETTLSHAYGRNKKLFTEMEKKKVICVC